MHCARITVIFHLAEEHGKNVLRAVITLAEVYGRALHVEGPARTKLLCRQNHADRAAQSENTGIGRWQVTEEKLDMGFGN